MVWEMKTWVDDTDSNRGPANGATDEFVLFADNNDVM